MGEAKRRAAHVVSPLKSLLQYTSDWVGGVFAESGEIGGMPWVYSGDRIPTASPYQDYNWRDQGRSFCASDLSDGATTRLLGS